MPVVLVEGRRVEPAVGVVPWHAGHVNMYENTRVRSLAMREHQQIRERLSALARDGAIFPAIGIGLVGIDERAAWSRASAPAVICFCSWSQPFQMEIEALLIFGAEARRAAPWRLRRRHREPAGDARATDRAALVLLENCRSFLKSAAGLYSGGLGAFGPANEMLRSSAPAPEVLEIPTWRPVGKRSLCRSAGQ